MKAIIIGGGIGGLTAALALRRVGIEVEVYERAPGPREVGAGISLWANALRALRAIDAAGPVLARGEAMLRAELRTSRGGVLKSQDAASLSNGDGLPAIQMIHRAELLDALLEQLPAGVVRFGHECLGVQERSHGAAAQLIGARGPTESRADFVVGADGINSVVRAGLLNDGRPRYAGYTAWRGVAEIPESLVAPGYVCETWGCGSRFGITRIGGGRVYWWAAINAPEGGRDGDARAELLAAYRKWARPVPQIIEATPSTAIIRNDIIDRPPVKAWGRGSITLLGDAAHPTTPNLGQGGCMAIEDGVILADRIRSAGDIPAALRTYETDRFARTTMVTDASWRIGVAGHWKNPLACWARDAVARLIPEQMVRRQQKALLEFRLR